VAYQILLFCAYSYGLQLVSVSVVTVSKFFLSVGFGRFCRKNLGFRFGLGFHDKHVVNVFLTSVHTVSSTKAEYSCKPNANHANPLGDAKGELATEF